MHSSQFERSLVKTTHALGPPVADLALIQASSPALAPHLEVYNRS